MNGSFISVPMRLSVGAARLIMNMKPGKPVTNVPPSDKLVVITEQVPLVRKSDRKARFFSPPVDELDRVDKFIRDRNRDDRLSELQVH